VEIGLFFSALTFDIKKVSSKYISNEIVAVFARYPQKSQPTFNEKKCNHDLVTHFQFFIVYSINREIL